MAKYLPVKRFYDFLKLEKKDISLIFYYAIFSGIVALSLPLGIQSIVSLIQGAQISTSWVVLVSLVTLGVILTGVLQLMQLKVIETIQQRIFVRASFEFSNLFPKIRLELMQNTYLPEQANRFFDTLTIQKGISKMLIDVPSSVLQILFALILLSFYHPFFILFGVLLLFLLYSVFKFTLSRGIETSLQESKYKYKVAHWLQEVARRVISFKSSGNTDFALQTNDKLVNSYLDARESHFKILVIQFIQLLSFKVLVTSGLLVIGGVLVLKNEMNIGQFIAAEIIILLIINSVEKLIVGLESFYDVLTAFEKVGQVNDIEIEKQEGHDSIKSKIESIELSDLKLFLPCNEVDLLKGIDLTIERNKHIFIQGGKSSGKTNLLKILAGVELPTTGRMLINGLSYKTFKPNDYRSRLGLVLEEEHPFDGSIKDNLTFGDASISDTKIQDVLQHVGLSEYIKTLALGLNTPLSSDSQFISSSVSKRILLARAILKNPDVLILENISDAYSDHETEIIIDYLTNPTQNWTLVVTDVNPLWKSAISTTYLLSGGYLNQLK